MTKMLKSKTESQQFKVKQFKYFGSVNTDSNNIRIELVSSGSLRKQFFLFHSHATDIQVLNQQNCMYLLKNGNFNCFV